MNYRNAIVYFAIRLEISDIEEDANNGDEDAQRLLACDGLEFGDMELRAASTIGRLLGKSIWNEGHDAFDDLICKFSADTLEDIENLESLLSKYHTGGTDNIDTGVPYVTAFEFMFYPQGVGGKYYGDVDGASGDLSDWILWQSFAA
jgi:hypothetical protein